MIYETEDINENSDFFTAFPVKNYECDKNLKKHCLFPIGVFHFDGDKKCDVPIALPIGDDEGFIGKMDATKHCGMHWLSYSKKDDVWKLDCDNEDLNPCDYNFENSLKSFENRKTFYNKNGYIQPDENKPASSRSHKSRVLSIPTYASTHSNWYGNVRKHLPHKLGRVDDPFYGKEQPQSVTFVDDGECDFRYLGFLDSYAYSRPLCSQVHLFYSPNNERVLTVVEFT